MNLTVNFHNWSEWRDTMDDLKYRRAPRSWYVPQGEQRIGGVVAEYLMHPLAY